VIARRPLLGVAAAAAAALLAGSGPADAASRTALFQQYYDKTDEIHAALHRVLEVDPGAADNTQALDNVALFRDEANDWVGSYRGTMSVGRKSFAETYAAINTVQGHYTSRGSDAPLPTKTKASAEKKLASAEAFLKREKAKDATPTPKGK
jgi:hypothetical protein